MSHPYEVIPPPGQPGGVEASESCRYPPKKELSILEAGYTIKLHGKRITKADVRRRLKEK